MRSDLLLLNEQGRTALQIMSCFVIHDTSFGTMSRFGRRIVTMYRSYTFDFKRESTRTIPGCDLSRIATNTIAEKKETKDQNTERHEHVIANIIKVSA